MPLSRRSGRSARANFINLDSITGPAQAGWICGGWYVENQLFGVKAKDPPVFVSALAVLLTAAIVAALIRSWRAARMDPLRALRHE